MFKDRNPGMSQKKLALLMGYNSQGSVSQYINGDIPLNLPALIKFSNCFGIEPALISPRLAAELADGRQYTGGGNTEAARLAARLSTADPTTIELVRLALYENDEPALSKLSPSLVAMVRALKVMINEKREQS